jgi:anti-sigma factor RsiW
MTAAPRTLTCRELDEFLADYCAGELSPDDRAVFEQHLAECTDCATYLRNYGETVRLAREAYADGPVPAEVPEGLVRAILDVRKRSLARSRKRRRRP